VWLTSKSHVNHIARRGHGKGRPGMDDSIDLLSYIRPSLASKCETRGLWSCWADNFVAPKMKHEGQDSCPRNRRVPRQVRGGRPLATVVLVMEKAASLTHGECMGTVPKVGSGSWAQPAFLCSLTRHTEGRDWALMDWAAPE
jgi:hypothetical protein